MSIKTFRILCAAATVALMLLMAGVLLYPFLQGGETISYNYASQEEIWTGNDDPDAPLVELPSDYCIDINTATRKELQNLPGIGEALAENIIAYRSETPFVSTEDLMKVKGIGEARYEAAAPYITVNGLAKIG